MYLGLWNGSEQGGDGQAHKGDNDTSDKEPGSFVEEASTPIVDLRIQVGSDRYVDHAVEKELIVRRW